MFMLVLMAIFFGLGCSTCAAFPTQCQKDGFFDPLKQIYLPCTECTVERQETCRQCCPTLKQEEPLDSINYDSEPHNMVTVPSVEYNADRPQYHVLGLFFHIFIIVMVVATMSTIVCIGFKVAKDRRTAQCCAHRDNHCNNNDAAVIQEVLTTDDVVRQESTIHNIPSTSTNLTASISEKQLPESFGRQGHDTAVL